MTFKWHANGTKDTDRVIGLENVVRKRVSSACKISSGRWRAYFSVSELLAYATFTPLWGPTLACCHRFLEVDIGRRHLLSTADFFFFFSLEVFRVV